MRVDPSTIDIRIHRTRFPSRLFFYAYRPLEPRQTDNHAVARLATLTLDKLTFQHAFPPDAFSKWSIVANAANAGKNWLFFYEWNTGVAATGFFQGDSFVQAKSFPAGTLLPGSTHAAVDGRGYLMLASPQRNRRTRVTFAQVLDDGELAQWWTTEDDLPAPHGSRGGASLIGLPDCHAWLTGSPSQGTSVVHLFDVKHNAILSSRTWNEVWEGMAFHRGALLLFDAPDKRGEICVIGENHELVTTATLERGTFQKSWQIVASTPSGLLCYDYATGHAQIRTLGRYAFPVTHDLGDSLGSLWEYIVPC